jgi:hypothetical protein
LLALIALASSTARAQDDDVPPPADSEAPVDDATATPSRAPEHVVTKEPKPTEGTKGEAHESLVQPAVSKPEEPPPVGPVERLPPSAYPEWKTRGIVGGSLWFSGNMHGMPWPYYPKTGIGVSGYVWVDTGYEFLKRGNSVDANQKDVLSEGRALLRVTPTYSSGRWYVQGQAELVANKEQSVAQPKVVDVDDLWIRVGQWKAWDFQVGRYEAFEVYHFGMGLDVNTLERYGATGDQTRSPPDVFELGGNSNIVYRQAGISNVALHVYPTDYLRLELLGQLGLDQASTFDTAGVRPAGVLDFGFLKIKASADYRKQFPQGASSKASVTVRGNAGAIQFVADPYAEGGFNIAYGSVDYYSPMNSTDPNASRGDYDTSRSGKDLDMGGFANVRVIDGLIVGGGVNYNQETDLQAGHFTHLQTFGAIQYLLLKTLYIRVVGAYAKGHLAPGNTPAWDNTMTSARLRLTYLF